MTQKDERAFAEFGDPHANRADLENLQPWFAHVRFPLPQANDAMSPGNFAAVAPALLRLPLKRSSLTSSSGFTPRIIVKALLSRHCASQLRTHSFCRQRLIGERCRPHRQPIRRAFGGGHDAAKSVLLDRIVEMAFDKGDYSRAE